MIQVDRIVVWMGAYFVLRRSMGVVIVVRASWLKSCFGRKVYVPKKTAIACKAEDEAL